TVAVRDTSCPNASVDVDAVSVIFVGARQTIKLLGGAALRPNSGLPIYTAVKTCVPMVGSDHFIVATPLTTATLPSQSSPSLKVTPPDVTGTPALVVTVAVNVIAWPKTAVTGTGASFVVVAGRMT